MSTTRRGLLAATAATAATVAATAGLGGSPPAAAQTAAGKDGTPATVTGAVRLDTSHIYKVEWDAEKKAWKEPVIETAGQAYTKLVSQPLKDKLKAMRTAGSTLTIFPDRRGHVHVDQR